MNRWKITLDGVPLETVDETVFVTDVVCTEKRDPLLCIKSGGGSVVTGADRAALEVTVCVEVHEHQPSRRQMVVDRIHAWSEGYRLQLATQPGRYLQVVCTARPSVSTLHWTEELRWVFTAGAVPFWQEEEARSVGGTGNAVRLMLNMPGNQPTVLEWEAVNRGEQVCTRVQVEGQAFEGLHLPPKAHLRVCLDSAGRMECIAVEDQQTLSVYAHRSEGSPQWVTLRPGQNQLTARADQPMGWTVRARGRWL